MEMKILNIKEMKHADIFGIRYPILVIENINGDKGYLMPYRMHRFQICSTINGDVTKGISEYSDVYKDMNFIHDDVAINFIEEEIAKCINTYLHGSYGRSNNNPLITYRGNIYSIHRYENNDWNDTLQYDFNWCSNIVVNATYIKLENLPYIDEFAESSLYMFRKYYKETVAIGNYRDLTFFDKRFRAEKIGR